jgi:hypothetical protein
LATSFLWLLRCTYDLVIDIKSVVDDWDYDEVQAQKILFPLLDNWISVTVVILVVVIARRPLWSDAALIPASAAAATEGSQAQQPQMMAAVYPNGVAYVQQPAPGYGAYGPPQPPQQMYMVQPPQPPQQMYTLQPTYPGQQPVYAGQQPMYPAVQGMHPSSEPPRDRL